METKNKTNLLVGLTIGTTLVLLAVAAVLSYVFISDRVVKLRDLNLQLQVLKTAATQSLAVQSLVDSTSVSRSKLDLYFITKATVGSFIGELETYSERAKVALTLDSPSIERDKLISPDKFLKFNLNFVGEFKQAMHFLDLVEMMPYKVQITAVNLSKMEVGNDKSDQWLGKVAFNLISYIDK